MPEPEPLAVGFRPALVRDVEVAPQGFLLLAADHADKVIVLDRSAHRDDRLRFDRLGMLSTEGAERRAAAIYGLDRFEERHWQRMEEALARTVEHDDHAPPSPRAPVVRPPARQMIHSGYMAR